MSILKDFKDFAMRGNVVDMAVGIIIGGAFGKIVSSLVTDVIMPPIGYLMGGVDFSNLAIKIKDAVGEAPAVEIRYGAFINSIINFLIVAAAIFFLVQLMSKLMKKKAEAPAPPPAPSREVLLLSEIRDLLKK
jgi:large conductance mechanosensitive channel